MSTLPERSAPVHVDRGPTHADRVHAICKSVELPHGRSVARKVAAIRDHFRARTGQELSAWDAVRELDRIVAWRDDMPFPAAYDRIAVYLIRSDYEVDMIHGIVAHLRRGGDVATCPGLEAWDRAAVAGLLPRDAPARLRDPIPIEGATRCRDA
jgi:hypothetical protein